MAEKTRAELKALFENGDVPTEDDYGDLIDSQFNIQDDTDLDLNANSIQFETSPTVPTASDGLLYWDADNMTLATVLDATNDVILQNGQEVMVRVVNKTGATIDNGTVVYINGAQGNRPTAAPAQADVITTSTVLGFATQDIANNAEGFITTFGEVRDLDTSSYSEGDVVYLSASTAGEFTDTTPSSPNFVVRLGVVSASHVNQGKIQANTQQPLAADNTLSADSDLVAPTQKAVKAYVDNRSYLSNYVNGITFVSTLTEEITLDLGTITAGEIYHISGYMSGRKGGTAGDTRILLDRSSGTGLLQYFTDGASGLTSIQHEHADEPASNTTRISVSGIAKVNTSGTYVLGGSVASAGSDSDGGSIGLTVIKVGADT